MLRKGLHVRTASGWRVAECPGDYTWEARGEVPACAAHPRVASWPARPVEGLARQTHRRSAPAGVTPEADQGGPWIGPAGVSPPWLPRATPASDLAPSGRRLHFS